MGFLVHKPKLIGQLMKWLLPRRTWPPEVQCARDLIAAVDAGGVPLHPGKVNQIARGLGLEVSSKAPVEDTIERVREAVKRAQEID